MTHEQLDLTGSDATIVEGRPLTRRQQVALELIRDRPPVTSDELGALLHADRQARGGRGHGEDVRCDYCTGEGRSMGEALRAKGLVNYRRTLGWVPAGTPAGRGSAARPAGASFGDFPEGF